MRPHKKLSLVVLVGAGLAVAAWVSIWLICFRNRPAHRFAVVEPGVLYRGGQPDRAGLEDILSEYHVRTVVNLRAHQPDDAWWQLEENICRQHGVRPVDIEISSEAEAASGIREFLAMATDPNFHPIYVHCEYGACRTGFAVAAYRIAVQKWSYDAAIAEADRMGFEAQFKTNREYDRLLRQLGAGEPWQKLGAEAPTTAQSATGP